MIVERGFQKALGYLSIRQSEQTKVLLSMLLGFLIGSIQNYLCAIPLALFLTFFSSSSLPQVYLLVAGLAIVLGILYAFFEFRLSFNHLNLGVILVIGCVTAIFWVGLITTGNNWLIAALFVWALASYDLIEVPFWTILNRIYNLEQGKRLFGIIAAGQNVGGLISGCTAPFLVLLIGTEQIILLIGVYAALAGLVLLYLQRTTAVPASEVATEDDVEDSISIKELIKNPLVLKLICMVALGIFGTYMVDIMFNTVAEERYPNEDTLAGFLGVFFGLIDGAGLILGTLLYARILRRFGLIGALLILPLICSIIAILLLIANIVPPLAVLIFWLLTLLKFTDESLKENLSDISLLLLIQPLSEKVRAFIQTKIDMIIVPAATAIVSLVLIALNYTIGIKIGVYTLIVLFFYGVYLIITPSIKANYIRELTNAIANRFFNPSSLVTIDKDSLPMMNKYLFSTYADEVIYALSAIEKIGPEQLSKALETSLASENSAVREFTLQKIGDYMLEEYLEKVVDIIEKDPNEQIKAKALNTAVKLKHPSIKKMVGNLLEDKSLKVRAAAIIEAFKLGDSMKEKARVRLLSMMNSPNVEEKSAGISIIGDINNPELNELLIQSIKDKDRLVKCEAYYSVIKVKKYELYPDLLQHLNIVNLSGKRLTLFLNLNDKIVDVVKNNFNKYSSPTRYKLLQYLGAIPTDKSHAFLEDVMLSGDAAEAQKALQALIFMKKKPGLTFLARVDRIIEEELTFLKLQHKNLCILTKDDNVQLLRNVIQRRLTLSLERLLFVLALYYVNPSLVRAKIGLESSNENEISYSVELIDNTINNQHKKIIIPVLNTLFFEENSTTVFSQDTVDFQKLIMENLIINNQDALNIMGCLAVLYIIKNTGLTFFAKEIDMLKESESAIIRETILWVKGD